MVEWTSSACLLAQTRLMMGMPWMRGALILSTVAVVTGLTGVALARQAMRLADEVLFFHEGRLLESGAKQELLQNPRFPETRQFLDFYGG